MMKRFLISALIVLFGAGAVLLYYWKQATQLPSWYTEQAREIDPLPANATEQEQAALNQAPTGITPPAQNAQTGKPKANQPGSSAQVQQEPANVPIQINEVIQQQTSSNGEVKVKLNPKQVNTLFSSALKRKVETSKLGQAVKGVNTTIQDGRIESGAVVNLAEVPIDQLPSSEQAFLGKLLNTFPELGQRSVYIGMQGKPIAEDGQVRLDDDTRLKVGNLSFTTAELAQRLGISEEQVRQRLQLEIQLGRLNASDVELEGNNVVIRGSGN